MKTCLTAPWDTLPVPDVSNASVVLTEEQVKEAVHTNVDLGLLEKFPKVDRMYADPIYNSQVYCLHSFIPSKGATPDEKGVFGFMKCRGSFHTVDEANQRAEFMIRNVDSYHDIQTGYAGRPFPVCKNTKRYVAETTEVNIRKDAVKAVSEDIQQKRLDEKKEVDDIKERESNLMAESQAIQNDTYVADPLELYTTLHVRKANLVFTYLETQKSLVKMRVNIKKSYREIRDMDVQDVSLAQQYYDHYMAARRKAHIQDDKSEENWMKYLGEDAPLDFDYNAGV